MENLEDIVKDIEIKCNTDNNIDNSKYLDISELVKSQSIKQNDKIEELKRYVEHDKNT